MDPVTEIKDVLDSMKGIVEGLGLDFAVGSEEDELGLEQPHRVIHLNCNPFDTVVEQEEAEYVNLKKENERLRAKLSLIETGCNDPNVTMRIDEAVNNAHQIEMLTQQVREFKEREEKILSSLKKTAGQFREACFSLIGYRVDALKDNIYRLSHRYANPNNDDERLFFEVKRDGTIKLIENGYSKRLSQQVSTYLDYSDSFPAFLAALTHELFKRPQPDDPSQTMDMSMSMSTTVLANPKYSRHL